MIPTIQSTKWTEGNLPGVIDDTIESVCDSRLVAGQLRYGNSWCQVDLKEDCLEELYDAINYLRLMYARIYHSGKGSQKIDNELADMIGFLVGIIIRMERTIPDFVGPTSNQWVRNQATTYDLS